MSFPEALYFIIPSLLCFRIFGILVKIFIPVPKSLHGSCRKQWLYHNTMVSLSHSCISSFLAVFCFYDEPAMFADMIRTWSRLSFYVVCFSTGYFLHDFVDVLLNDFQNSAGLLFHHVLTLLQGWYEKGPAELHWERFVWQKELQSPVDFTVPRFYRLGMVSPSSIQLRLFGDASEKKFCAVAYFRFEYPGGERQCAFVVANTYVAPVKPISIPRLDLQKNGSDCVVSLCDPSCMACIFSTFLQQYLAFPACFLLMEINSVFLHVRRLMRYHQMHAHSQLYRFNMILVLTTFVVFRFIFVVWMENIVITHRQHLYFPHFLFGFVGISGMMIVNVFLFIFLCKAEFGGKSR